MSNTHPAPAPRAARPPRPRAALTALLALLCLLALQTGGTANATEASATAERAAPTSALATADAVPLVAGGDTVYADAGYSCTVVVNLAIGTGHFGLLPGSCTDSFPHWYADPQLTTPIGPTVSSQYPTHGLFAYDNPAVPVEQTTSCGGAPLTTVANPVVGQAVTRSGSTTGCLSGTVTGVNVTVNFGGQVVTGLIATNLCWEPGFRDGALTSRTALVGIPVGGSGNCASGGVSYFQPLAPVLAAYGATIV
ncbi:S1 family peptidase [Streptomyces sp. DSM 44915]|uniref:S1 family peptidase n=1 Tax=Streptomyces chisholmiae TaxID=3075540 RepID=A0ABU2JTE8_9ACTN|nr:S1 family peptidase [Streptomyces sp. DSM 44915]MDT0267458.1 S1 family peptidase [Streptomyces sp. DSM 44915]